MTLRDLLSGLPGLHLDPRLHLRGKESPASVTTVRVEGDLGPLMDRALRSDPMPVAIVRGDGTSVVLTSGESGVIWTIGEPTDEQSARVAEIGDAIAQVSGMAMTGVVAPKKRKQKQDEVAEPVAEVEEPVVEEPVADEPETDDGVLVIGEI